MTTDDVWREGGLVRRHQHLLDTGFMADCNFLVGVEGGEKKRFQCHKFILGHSSSVLHAMFNGGLNPKEEEKIEDIQPEHFQKFLEYIYLDTVELNDVETAMGVAYTAEKYLVKTLRNKCFEFINNNFEDPTIVCRVLEFSRLISAEEMQKKCMDYIKANTNRILADENFELVEKTTLMAILEQEKLCIFSEADLFSACVRWAQSSNIDETAEDGLAKTLGPALQLFRFLTFTVDEFVNLVVSTKILPEKICLAILCRIVTGNGDIPDEISNCCDSRATMESLTIPLLQYSTYNTRHMGGWWPLNIISSNVSAYLHGVKVLASRYNSLIGEEYEENVKVVIWANNSEQTSESFVGLVKRDESFDIYFKKSFLMIPGVKYTLQLVYSDLNIVHVSYEPQLSEILTKCNAPFIIDGYSQINAIVISKM